MHELSHRSKNLLSVIQAMAQQTARLSPSSRPSWTDSMPGFAVSRPRRTCSSVKTGVARCSKTWCASNSCPSAKEMGAASSSRGRPCFVIPDAAQTLGLALHELATNASKYGALSVSGGSVAVHWKLEPGGGVPRFRISWRESGGPRVNAPERSGFGRMLIERLTAEKLDATVLLTFERDGVVWTLDAAAPDVLAEVPPDGRQ